MSRRMNFQTISWFWDLYQRDRLKLDPPYQRRAVWNQNYKDYFIETILLEYPAPAIFLYEEMGEDGRATYNVVDGKQRLVSIFEFVQDEFAVIDNSQLEPLQGQYFRQFDAEQKKHFWAYQFAVEYLPDTNETVLKNIFDRINRNVAKLTPQELRHARYGGEFISMAESLADFLFSELPQGFPNIAGKSQKQMKDVELVSTLLLMLEEGVKSYSQDDLDKAFAEREETWGEKRRVEQQFRDTVSQVSEVVSQADGQSLIRSRLRNQADFYSLFGALSSTEGDSFDATSAATRLRRFVDVVEDEQERHAKKDAASYFEAARSASNDAGPRNRRIEIIKSVIAGGIAWCA